MSADWDDVFVSATPSSNAVGGGAPWPDEPPPFDDAPPSFDAPHATAEPSTSAAAPAAVDADDDAPPPFDAPAVVVATAAAAVDNDDDDDAFGRFSATNAAPAAVVSEFDDAFGGFVALPPTSLAAPLGDAFSSHAAATRALSSEPAAAAPVVDDDGFGSFAAPPAAVKPETTETDDAFGGFTRTLSNKPAAAAPVVDDDGFGSFAAPPAAKPASKPAAVEDDDGFGSFAAPPAAKSAPKPATVEDDDGFGSFAAPAASKPLANGVAHHDDDDGFGDFRAPAKAAAPVATAPAAVPAPAAAPRVRSTGPRTDLSDAVRACSELFAGRNDVQVAGSSAPESWRYLQQRVKANMEQDQTWRPLKCTTCDAPLFSFASVCVNCGTVRSLGLLAAPAATATVPFVGTAAHTDMVTSLKLPRALAEATARAPSAEEEAIRKASQPVATRHAPPARPIPEALLRKAAAATPPKPKQLPAAAIASTPSKASSVGFGLDLLAQPAPAAGSERLTVSTGSQVAASVTMSPAQALTRSVGAVPPTTVAPTIGLDDDPFGAPAPVAAAAVAVTAAPETKAPAPSVNNATMFGASFRGAGPPATSGGGGLDDMFALPANPVAPATAVDPFASLELTSPTAPAAKPAGDPFGDFLMQSPVAPTAAAPSSMALPDLSFMK